MIKNGFSLIELLIVMAIIGILTGIGVTSFENAQNKALDAKRLIEVRQISDSLKFDRVGDGKTSFSEDFVYTPSGGHINGATSIVSFLTQQGIVLPSATETCYLFLTFRTIEGEAIPNLEQKEFAVVGLNTKTEKRNPPIFGSVSELLLVAGTNKALEILNDPAGTSDWGTRLTSYRKTHYANCQGLGGINWNGLGANGSIANVTPINPAYAP